MNTFSSNARTMNDVNRNGTLIRRSPLIVGAAGKSVRARGTDIAIVGLVVAIAIVALCAAIMHPAGITDAAAVITGL